MDCSPPGSSVHGIFLGKNTGVGCHFLLQGSSWFMYWTQGPCIGRQILYHWATREAPKYSAREDCISSLVQVHDSRGPAKCPGWRRAKTLKIACSTSLSLPISCWAVHRRRGGPQETGPVLASARRGWAPLSVVAAFWEKGIGRGGQNGSRCLFWHLKQPAFSINFSIPNYLN